MANVYPGGNCITAHQNVSNGTDLIYKTNDGRLLFHSHPAVPVTSTQTTAADALAGAQAIHMSSMSGILPGILCSGANIPANCTVAAINTPTTGWITITQIVYPSTLTAGSTLTFTTGALGIPLNWNVTPPDTVTIPAANPDGTYGAQHATDPYTYAIQQVAGGLGFGQNFSFVYDGVTIYGTVA